MAEYRHVVRAIHDAQHHLVAGEPIRHAAQIRPPLYSVPLDRMAVYAGLIVGNHSPIIHRPGRSPYDISGQRNKGNKGQ